MANPVYSNDDYDRNTPSTGGYPTPFADVNEALGKLRDGAKKVLGDQFVGLYIHGSLAAGDFDYKSSDIDTMIVTKGVLAEEKLVQLGQMHAGLVDEGNKFTQPGNTETYYVPQDALARYSADDPARPRHIKGEVKPVKQGQDWVLHRHVLREQGIAVEGPDLKPMIDPVSPDDMRHAVANLLTTWWMPMMRDAPDRFKDDMYQANVIRTVCRALHTLETGELLSKVAATDWATTALPENFQPALKAANAWQEGQKMGHFEDLRSLINYAAEKAGPDDKPAPKSPSLKV